MIRDGWQAFRGGFCEALRFGAVPIIGVIAVLVLMLIGVAITGAM